MINQLKPSAPHPVLMFRCTYLHPGEAAGSSDYPDLPKDGFFAEMPGDSPQTDLSPCLPQSGWKETWKGWGKGLCKGHLGRGPGNPSSLPMDPPYHKTQIVSSEHLSYARHFNIHLGVMRDAYCILERKKIHTLPEVGMSPKSKILSSSWLHLVFCSNSLVSKHFRSQIHKISHIHLLPLNSSPQYCSPGLLPQQVIFPYPPHTPKLTSRKCSLIMSLPDQNHPRVPHRV